MCKAMEDMRNAAALEAEILSAVKTCRDLGQTEKQIKTYIMTRFNLSEAEAKSFLDARPAA